MSVGKAPSSKDAILLDQSMPLETVFKPQPQRVKWVTAEIAERFEREYYLVTAARELIFYLIFLFCATMVVLVKIDSNGYFMTAAIKEQIVGNKFKVEEHMYEFSDIRNVHFLHTYFTEYLADQLYWTSFDTVTRVQLIPKKDRGVLYVNKLIGQPTLRQLAVKNGTCKIHPRFERHEWVCQPGYQNGIRLKDESLPGCTVPEDGCKYADSQTTLAVRYQGELANYADDGFVVQMGLDRETFKETAMLLKTNGWYSLNSRALFLDFMLYNPNLDMFCGVKLIFELPPVGGVVPTAKFYTFNALHFQKSFMRFAAGCFLIYALYLIYYFAGEMREIIYLKINYFKVFWSYLDFAVVGLGITHVVLTIKIKMMLLNLDEPMNSNSADIRDYSLQNLAYTNHISSNVQGFTLFLIYMKVLKYFGLNALTDQLNATLSKSGRYLVFFSMIFFVVLIAFAEFGYQVYGRDIDEYSTIPTAIFTLLRTLLADFNYEKLEKTHRTMAPIFFVLFIFMVFFVLVNMFLAIICGNYTNVKTDTAVGPEIMQMTEFWKRGCHNMCKSLNCYFCANLMAKRNEYNVAAEQIRVILNRCGFSNLDVDVFMARYHVAPADLIKVRDISKLLEFLRMPIVENMAPKKGVVNKPESNTTGQPLMALEDFKAQQQKLDEIEQYITSIAEKIESLLMKMNTLSELRK